MHKWLGLYIMYDVGDDDGDDVGDDDGDDHHPK